MKSPIIKGLVMAGGESSRMGFDKGLIEYHGMPQQDYLFELLTPLSSAVFISRRKSQHDGHDARMLNDVYEDMGPFSGILSAFKYDPECAWLVVACDFPLINAETLNQLVAERDDSSFATSFLDEGALMPEPWVTILEPKIYPILLDYYKQGRSSLRGVLVDYNSTVVRVKDKDVLLNANTPDEAERLKERIRSK